MKYIIRIEADLDIKQWMKFLAENESIKELYDYEHRKIEEPTNDK